MILWFRQSLPRQLLGLFILTLFSAALDYWWAPTPPVRLHYEMVLRGLVAGGFIAFISTVISLFSREVEADVASPDPFDFFGLVCLSAAGEEIFFRGYLFNAFLRFDPRLAFILHTVVLSAASYRGRRRLLWLFLRLSEGTLLALAFYRTRSLALCVTAHMVLLIYRRFFLPPLHQYFRNFLERLRAGKYEAFSA